LEPYLRFTVVYEVYFSIISMAFILCNLYSIHT
jgi:hypothetical protein